MKSLLIAASLVALGVSSVSASSPDRKNKMSGQEVIQIYNGKTWIWSKGGSYWGSGGNFEAVWDGAVGVGKWYATSNGKLCYEAEWRRTPVEGSVLKRCWPHVRDSKGRIWKQDPQDKNWYRAEKEMSERIKPGNKIKSEVRKLRKKTGL